MFWVFRKFGYLIGLVLALLGALYLPADFLERENALRVAQKTLTVGNREIILAVICALALLRLGYLDLRRALNDPHWPPVRHKLRQALAAVFKRERRIAEIRNVAEHPLMLEVLESAIARELLEKLDWGDVEHPPILPKETDDAPMRNDYHRYKQRSGPTKQALSEIQRQIDIIEKRLGPIGLADRLNSVVTDGSPNAEYGQLAENQWGQACQKINEFNTMKREIERCLKRHDANWEPQKFNPSASRLRQSLLGIAAKKQQ